MDSLADAITFGLAPAVLALTWGMLFASTPNHAMPGHLSRVGYVVAFFYLLCGTVRLARFNVQANPSATSPLRLERKYFAGMPIPAAALFIGAVVYMMDGAPVRSFALTILWMCGVAIVSLLMVSTWRYPSFKHIGISKPHTPLIVVLIGGIAFLIWNWAQPMLLAMACAYVASGICIRIASFVRRHRKPREAAPVPEHQVG